MKRSIIAEKSYRFSLRIIQLHIYLCTKEKYIYNLSVQLLKSGTSIGANIEEGLGGYSNNDFSAKFGIAYKEARKTKYWIRLLADSGYIDDIIRCSLLSEIEEIIKIIASIITTMRNKKY